MNQPPAPLTSEQRIKELEEQLEFATQRAEFLLSRPANLEQAQKMVKESIAIYNGERPHLSLEYKTPDTVHQAFYKQKCVNLYQD